MPWQPTSTLLDMETHTVLCREASLLVASLLRNRLELTILDSFSGSLLTTVQLNWRSSIDIVVETISTTLPKPFLRRRPCMGNGTTKAGDPGSFTLEPTPSAFPGTRQGTFSPARSIFIPL